MSEKYDKITAHLVSAMETIASTFGDTPTMIRELEGRLDKIRKIYHDHQDSNPPATVSDGKSLWDLGYPAGEITPINYNDECVGRLNTSMAPALHTLIAKAEIAEKMYQLLKLTDGDLPWQDWRRQCTTLIAEYEAMK